MRKSLALLVILGTASAPALAQSPVSPQAPVANQIQPAKPVMVKKRICHYAEEDSYSRLGGRKICKTVEVPADQQQKPATQPVQPHSGS